MPVIKSAKKRMRQNVVRRSRNSPVRSELKSLFKKELVLIKGGNREEAEKFLRQAFSIIDTACKKKILHPNTAARRKSRLARALNDLVAGKELHVAVAKGNKEAPNELVVAEEA